MTRQAKKFLKEAPAPEVVRASVDRWAALPEPPAAPTASVAAVQDAVDAALAAVRLSAPITHEDAAGVRDLLLARLPAGECSVEVFHRADPAAGQKLTPKIMPDSRPQLLVVSVWCGPGRTEKIERALRAAD